MIEKIKNVTGVWWFVVRTSIENVCESGFRLRQRTSSNILLNVPSEDAAQDVANAWEILQG